MSPLELEDWTPRQFELLKRRVEEDLKNEESISKTGKPRKTLGDYIPK